MGSDFSFVQSELLQYGQNVVLESVVTGCDELSHYTYISDTETTQGYIVQLKFKKHNKFKNVYIKVYDAGKMSSKNELNKKQFQDVQLGKYENKIVTVIGAKIDDIVIENWRKIIEQEQLSKSISFPWISILSSMIVKSLKCISNDDLSFAEYISSKPDGLEACWNTRALEKMWCDVDDCKEVLKIKTDHKIKVADVLNACFLAANDIFNNFVQCLKNNKISMRAATKSLMTESVYWTKELTKEEIKQDQNLHFDSAVKLSKEIIEVVKKLRELSDQIDECAEGGLQIIEKLNSRHYSTQSESIKLKIKTALVARQKALLCARVLYADLIEEIWSLMISIEHGMKMFSAYQSEVFQELAKEYDSLMNICLYTRLSMVSNKSNLSIMEINSIVTKSKELISEKCKRLTESQIQSLVLFALEAQAKISSTKYKLDTIFADLVDDVDKILDVEKYIVNFMNSVRKYTSYSDIEANKLLSQSKLIENMHYNFERFLDKYFGISAFVHSKNEQMTSKHLWLKHAKLLHAGQHIATDLIDVSKAFELIFKSHYDGKPELFVVRNGSFCMAKELSNNSDKSLSDTNTMFQELLIKNEFVPKGEVKKDVEVEQAKSVVTNLWNKLYSTYNSTYQWLRGISPDHDQVETVKDTSSLQHLYHPAINNTEIKT